ncbi:MAG: decaprenyl-phosphate phosphoribosyltransferase [Elainellaceae cyanobacterium]
MAVSAHRKFSLASHIAALRPRQWTKNLVIFAAPIFAFSINADSMLGSALAFVLFCSLSSSFYLLNDVADVESDRQHPVKCNRPIASGMVKVPTAVAMAIVLMAGALTIGWMQSFDLGRVLSAYAVLQIAYNLKLKRTPILDIVAIATGFVLRASAGAAATSISLSPWFLLCTAMLALFLGIEKRKAELRLLKIKGGKTRSVLKRYSLSLLTRMESTVTTGAVMSYALWSSGPLVNGATTPWMLITLPFVLYGIFRYQLLSDPEELERRTEDSEPGGQTERPEEVLLRDRPILLTVLGWVLTILVILWLQKQGIIQ